MYSLTSFGPDFFFAEGEPYDPIHVNSAGQPVSLYGAISNALKNNDIRNRVAKILGCEPKHITVETLYDMAIETDECYNLTVPIEVRITKGLTVLVYE